MITHQQFLSELPLITRRLAKISKVKHIQRRVEELQFQWVDGYKYDVIVSYHQSYNTPVIYFRVYDPLDDRTVPHEGPCNGMKVTMEEYNSTIWNYIHPCDTDVMVIDSLELWVSVYLGRVVSIGVDEWEGSG
jgi:hypothetical protein